MDSEIETYEIIKCGICNDYFVDPTTLPCGHNFCMTCISTQWDQELYEEVHSCPKCSRTFDPKPELTLNQTLSIIGSKLKRWSLESPDGNITEPKQDISNPQPQLKNKTRVKEKPQDMLCVKHKKLLNLYCRDDEKCICDECHLFEHREHDTVPAEEGRREMEQKVKAFLQMTKADILKRELNLKKLSATSENVKESSRSAVEANEKVFTELIASLEKMKDSLSITIQRQETALVNQAESEQKQQRQNIQSMQAMVNDLEKLSNLKQDVFFITKSQSIISQQETGPVTMRVHENPSFNFVAVAIYNMKEMVDGGCKDAMENIQYKVRTVQLVKTPEEKPTMRIPPPKPVRRSQTDISGPRPQIPRRQPSNMKTRQHFLKYACPLILDPDTAHSSLNISVDNTRASVKQHRRKSLFEISKSKFDHWEQVLCKEGLKGGRFYWEIEWSGKGVFIGMALEGIARKGDGLECGIGHNVNSWCLECTNLGFFAWHNNIKTDIDVKVFSPRIGIYLDDIEGSLEFFSVSDTMTLIHRFILGKSSATFYPIFGFGLGLGLQSWIQLHKLDYSYLEDP